MADFNALQKIGLGLQLTDNRTQNSALQQIQANRQIGLQEEKLMRAQQAQAKQDRIKQIDYNLNVIAKGAANISDPNDRQKLIQYNTQLLQERDQLLGGSPQANGGSGQPTTIYGNSALMGSVLDAPEPINQSVIISGDDPRNQSLGLGIPKGEKAKVSLVMDSQGNVVRGDVESRFGASTNITNTNSNTNTVADESEFRKKRAGSLNDQLTSIEEAGNSAANLQSELTQLSDLVSTTDFQSGNLQPFITGVQGIADDLGIDINSVAKEMGFSGIGDLSTKKEADRLFNRVVLDNFEKIKGNLNAQEVKIAKSTFGDIGDNEEANIDAIAASLAANQIAREYASESHLVETNAQGRQLLASKAKRGTKRFNELKKQFKDEMIKGRKESESAAEPTKNVFTEEKRKRLEELRKKQAEGTLDK